jgi:hypothetical protein
MMRKLSTMNKENTMKLHHDDYHYGWSTGFTYVYWLALFVAVIFIMMITGCAPMQLKADATPEQQRAAWCQEATNAYTLSTAMMNSTSMTPEQAKYYSLYQIGASTGISLYCPGPKQ